MHAQINSAFGQVGKQKDLKHLVLLRLILRTQAINQTNPCPKDRGIFMRRLSAILLSLILCITFFGCSADKATVLENESEPATIAADTTQGESTINAEKGTEQSDKTTSAAKNSKTTVSTPNKNNADGNTDNYKNTDNNTTAESNNATVGKQTNTPAKPTTKKAATAKQTTTSSSITCSVTIECTSVLDNTDKLKEGHEEYVPSDGYIMSSCSVTIPNDSTAYDAVKAACESQGVTMNVVSSSYGKYIAGFNNIDEKDCGNQSGWLYFVNGSSPSKSCSKYKLSNGDNVVFSYTCS